jgi:hypothetical protein
MAKTIQRIHRLLAVVIILAVFFYTAIDTFPSMASPITGFVPGTVQLSIASATTITMPNATIDFGTMQVNETNETRDNAPYPFIVQNDGNVPVNVTVKATNLFQNYTNPTTNFQVACGNYTVGGNMTGYNCTTLSNTTYLPVRPSTENAALIVYNLTWEDTKDKARLDFNVSIGPAEVSGAKSSTVTVSGVISA